MRLYLTIATLLLFAITSELHAQSQYNGMAYYNNGTMREIDDSLNVSFSIEVNRQVAPRGGAIRLIPTIVAEGNSVQMPDVLITGSNKNKILRRWQRLMSRREKARFIAPSKTLKVDSKTDSDLNYAYQIPYQMWMDSAHMVLYIETLGPANHNSMLAVSVSDKVELSPRVPYQVQAVVAFTEPVAVAKSLKKQGQAFLDFQSGRSVIDPSYRRNPQELAKIKQAFADIQGNKDATIVGLYINGYASPEGRFDTNERLSRERAFGLRDYVVTYFKPTLSSDQIKVAWTVEDWDGLKLMIEESEISRKAEILSAIDNTTNADEREAKIKHIAGGAPYQTMLRNMFPLLRRVEYQIDYTVNDFSTDQTKALIGKSNELLNQRELYLAAQSYGQGSKEYNYIIIELIPTLFSSDPTATVNAAALMIEQDELQTAKRYLDRFPQSAQAINNLGVIALKNGELETAEQLFNTALKAGATQAQINIEQTQKKRHDNIRMERFR